MHPLLIVFFVVLGLLILLVVGILVAVRRGIQGFQKALEGVNLAAQVSTPARLHLRRAAAPGWTNPTARTASCSDRLPVSQHFVAQM